MKNLTKILLWLIVIGLIIFIFSPRSIGRMESIAKDELKINVSDSMFNLLQGPLIFKEKKYVEFVWYKKLEWGDTSKIFIRVYRSIFSCHRFDSWWRNYFCFLEPQVNMNYQWYYFLFADGTSNFQEVFPLGIKGIKIETAKDLSTKNTKDYHYKFTVPTNRISYLLKKGYFRVLQKKEETTIIEFYEPIANIYIERRKDAISVITAKVFSNDTTGITIIPFIAPKELWD